MCADDGRTWRLAMMLAVATAAGAAAAVQTTVRPAGMRTGPGAFYEREAQLDAHTEVTIEERQERWVRGSIPGHTGWLPVSAFEVPVSGQDYAGLLTGGEAVLVSTVDIAAATKGAFENAYAEQHKVSYGLLDQLDRLRVDPHLVRELERGLTPAAGVSHRRLPSRPYRNSVVLSPEAEVLIGRALAAHLGGGGMIADTAVLDYVNAVAAIVGARTPRYDLTYRVAVLEDDGINGYGLPGGIIIITSGLLGAMRSEAELAGLLAHEMAHICLYHGLREFQKRDLHRRRDAVFEELDAHTAEDASRETARDLGRMADRAYLTIIGSRAREDEFEADLFGAAFAAAAGYDPDALIDLLTRVATQAGGGDAFRHHPGPAERIRALREGIGTYRLGDRRQTRQSERFAVHAGRFGGGRQP